MKRGMTAKAFLLLPALLLAACGSGASEDANLDSLDNELAEGVANNAADPVLTAALQDQIMVDPQLAQKANKDAIRPPSQPYSAPIPSTDIAGDGAASVGALKSAPAPTGTCKQCTVRDDALTLGALAQAQKTRGTANCVRSMRYGAAWANRLPKDLPLYPNAKVIEAAGSSDGGCALRAVTFTTSQPMKSLLDFYYTRATGAGYSAEHQSDGNQHVLGGTRGRDGGAYVVYLSDRTGGGTDVDIVANNGN